jgi:hypothetical protein
MALGLVRLKETHTDHRSDVFVRSCGAVGSVSSVGRRDGSEHLKVEQFMTTHE